MATRRGRKGDHLVTDDYTGCTTYASRVRKDYWGNYGEKILKRNLQEIATPLDDPRPVSIYLGPQYENTTACQFETQPIYIGRTTRPFPQNQVTAFFGLDPAIGDAAVGCTLVVH